MTVDRRNTGANHGYTQCGFFRKIEVYKFVKTLRLADRLEFLNPALLIA